GAVKRNTRPVSAVLLGVAAAVALAACGGSSSSSSSSAATSSGSASGSTSGHNGGTITIASGTPPLSADQGLDFTTQGNELYSVVNTPLLTFKRGVQGVAGTLIVPALAQSLPTVSNGGKTYSFQLRRGPPYSNGTAMRPR